MRASWICGSLTFLLMSALPFLQTWLPIVPGMGTSGVENHHKLPALTLENFLDGSMQSGFERWLSENIGLRGALIRTDNQINYSLFGELSSNSRVQVILGRDNYLFERGYISAYVHQKALPKKRLTQIANGLIALQQALKSRGIPFVLLLSPSKAHIYEDFLPSTYHRRKLNRPGNYEVLLPLLKERGINLIDGIAMAADYKARGLPAFARAGTHWSMYLACHIGATVFDAFSTQSGITYTPMPCEPTVTSATPDVHDADLSSLSNLWSQTPFFEPLPYPQVTPSDDPKIIRPSLAAIGSSFMWSVLYYWDQYKVYSDRDFYYYFRTRHQFPSLRKSVVDRGQLNWDKDILGKDLVLVEINQTDIKNIGFGFIEEALQRLNKVKAKK